MSESKSCFKLVPLVVLVLQVRLPVVLVLVVLTRTGRARSSWILLQESVEVIAATSRSSLEVKENEGAATVTTPSPSLTWWRMRDDQKNDMVESRQVIQAQLEASRTAAGTTSTCQIRKRKRIDSVDANLKPLYYCDAEKQNILLSPSLSSHPQGENEH
ncbi:uncharacterized protein EDB93DRAFT_1106720 [Suillus bovinus]|uniref:uncharacterized protein n=1 Tax=Suillus bovinus TaxID=48563 RepID=UPI001B8747E3|nr:uncharacterized protein EDB93DRAFT_1106720 [Suillus bovinus]KAG2136922.1 hypothetical protein EDB93DRAFT_1106720 [Suillus bovinus]